MYWRCTGNAKPKCVRNWDAPHFLAASITKECNMPQTAISQESHYYDINKNGATGAFTSICGLWNYNINKGKILRETSGIEIWNVNK